MDLSGEWEGFYLNPEVGEGEFPVKASLKVEDGRLRGTMSDERRVWSVPVKGLHETFPKGSKNALLWKEFALQYPNAIVTTHIPQDSVLTGTVTGRQVRFRKVYQGPDLITYTGSGLDQTSEERTTDILEYAGIANEEGTSIGGRWTIYKRSLFGIKLNALFSGDFKLTRTL